MHNAEVVIVGGGAAGLSAALMLVRSRRSVLVVDAGEPRNAPAEHMHGFLSRDGTPPGELLAAGRAEVEGYGGRVVRERVRRIDRDGFTVELDGGVVRTKAVVVATGARDELPDVTGMAERWGRDVLHCPYCHGWEVRDQSIGVLGSAHQALLVRQLTDRVTHIGDTTDDRLTRAGVSVIEGKATRLVVQDDRLTGVELADGTTVPVTALFVPSVPHPNDNLLTALGCDTEDDVVRVDPAGRTSVPGVYAAGNVVEPMATVVIAAAAGARTGAAINFDLIERDN